MSENESPPPGIGLEFVKELYLDCKLEPNEPQPIFLIYKDTIKTFLHEKIGHLALNAKILGLIGIEISILAALFTATFNDVWQIKGEMIQALFIVLFFVLGFFLARDFKRWWQNRNSLTVDALTDELGRRASIIKSSGRPTTTETTGG